jgi:hypothetical protein
MTELQTAVFEFLDTNPDVSMKDFLNKIKADFKEYKDHVKKEKKNVKSDVVKPLNAYQLFVKEQMKKFKDDDSKLTGKELMKEISILWKKSKDEVSGEVFEDSVEESVEEVSETEKVPEEKVTDKKKGKEKKK